MANKYQNTKVYKIWSLLGDKIYIGSTTKEYLSQRMTAHRTDYKHWKNGKRGKITSFDLFDEYGIDNCKIELLEAKECNSFDERRQLEAKHIRNLDCVNKNIPGRTPNEYYDYNKEKILEKAYTKCSCQCGGKFTVRNKPQHERTEKHLKFIEQLDV